LADFGVRMSEDDAMSTLVPTIGQGLTLVPLLLAPVVAVGVAAPLLARDVERTPHAPKASCISMTALVANP
jgi:hypothetical protein